MAGGGLGVAPDRLRRIGALATPIVGAMVSQNVLNLVDTKMVGSLGDAAIAAVGSASFVSFACVSLVTGLSSGVQAQAARRLGEHRIHDAVAPLNAGLLMSLCFGVPATLILWQLAPTLFPYVNPDPEVVAQAVPYLRARLIAIAPIGMSFAFRGYWNGIDRPRLYLSTLLVQHSVNIAAEWVLIFGHFGMPALGTLGAGVAAVIGALTGVLTYVVLALRHRSITHFPGRFPDLPTVSALLRLSLPTSLQQLLFALGFVVLFWVIGQLGQAEAAAASVLINVTLIALLPGLALGLTSMTLVGQALGQKDPDDAYRWGWDVVKVGVVIMVALGLPMVAIPDRILGFFLPGRPETVAVGTGALRLVGGLIGLDAVGMVLMNALLGAGAARLVAGVAIGLQWGFFLPVAWLVGPRLGGTLTTIWAVQAIQRGLQAIAFGVAWWRRRWAAIRI
ncbi:MAG: MATE family efflux transporter [Alphaproteobacteria bacterium]|nr:MATE family efflux transporter [Alphaproteobacteria bacterium]MCB9695265.1 MATE family efflux transporter [Alphaproteobacteria bacterium]